MNIEKDETIPHEELVKKLLEEKLGYTIPKKL